MADRQARKRLSRCQGQVRNTVDGSPEGSRQASAPRDDQRWGIVQNTSTPGDPVDRKRVSRRCAQQNWLNSPLTGKHTILDQHDNGTIVVRACRATWTVTTDGSYRRV